MDNTILRVSHLTKKYGSKVALDDVSFEIKKGRIYGFIGENGAGKTSAIRALTGLTTVEAGTVELFDESSPKGLEKARKNMGCLVEHPILSKNKIAIENLRLQQLLYGQSDDGRIYKLLERVGLSNVKNKKVKDFSLGMKQRLGIAMALINSPELLILDEPLNGLDPMGMVDVRGLLRSLCVDDGITILIFSHILAELYQLVTDYIIISGGKIIETLSKDELDKKYLSYVIVETTKTQEAIKALKEHGVKLVVCEDEILKVYDNTDIKDVAKWLFDAKILVTHLTKHEKSLESYYMELFGGNR